MNDSSSFALAFGIGTVDTSSMPNTGSPSSIQLGLSFVSDARAIIGASYVATLMALAADLVADDLASTVTDGIDSILADHSRDRSARCMCDECGRVVLADIISDHTNDAVWIGSTLGGAVWIHNDSTIGTLCDDCALDYVASARTMSDRSMAINAIGLGVCRAYLATLAGQ